MSVEIIRSTLRSSRIFQCLTTAEIDDLAAICHIETIEAGQWLFRGGDPGDSLRVVITGAVEILMETSPPTRLALLRTHEVFGELSLIEPDRRSAGARTFERSTFVRMDYSDFERLRETFHPGAHKFTRELAKIVCSRIRDVNERISLVLSQQDEQQSPELRASQRRQTIIELLKKLWNAETIDG